MTDGSVPVRDRLVSIEADLGDGAQSRWRYGSGLLIGGRRVLTAAHVVKGAKTVSVRRPGGELRPADLATSLVGEPDGVDLAVLEVPTAEALGPVPVAVVNRDVTDGSFVQGCWAVGYPAFQEIGRDGGRSLRETAEVRGEIPPLSGLQGGLLSLLVTSSPQRLPSAGAFNTSEWSGMSGAAVLWDPSAPGDPGQELGGHDGEAWAVTFLGDGRVVSGGGDRAVRLWEVSADLQERELGRHDGWSWAVAVTGDGKVVSGGDDGAVLLWNPSATDQPGRELGRHDSTVRAVAVTGDGKVISGGDDGAVRMWDPSTPSDPAVSSATTTARCGRWPSPGTAKSSRVATTGRYCFGTPPPPTSRDGSSAATTAR